MPHNRSIRIGRVERAQRRVPRDRRRCIARPRLQSIREQRHFKIPLQFVFPVLLLLLRLRRAPGWNFPTGPRLCRCCCTLSRVRTQSSARCDSAVFAPRSTSRRDKSQRHRQTPLEALSEAISADRAATRTAGCPPACPTCSSPWGLRRSRPRCRQMRWRSAQRQASAPPDEWRAALFVRVFPPRSATRLHCKRARPAGK